MFLQEVHTVIEGEHLSLLLKWAKNVTTKLKSFFYRTFFFHEFYAFMLFVNSVCGLLCIMVLHPSDNRLGVFVELQKVKTCNMEYVSWLLPLNDYTLLMIFI